MTIVDPDGNTLPDDGSRPHWSDTEQYKAAFDLMMHHAAGEIIKSPKVIYSSQDGARILKKMEKDPHECRILEICQQNRRAGLVGKAIYVTLAHDARIWEMRAWDRGKQYRCKGNQN